MLTGLGSRRGKQCRGVDGEVRRRRSELLAGEVDAGWLRLLVPTSEFCVALRSQGGGQRGWGSTGGEEIPRRRSLPAAVSV